MNNKNLQQIVLKFKFIILENIMIIENIFIYTIVMNIFSII